MASFDDDIDVPYDDSIPFSQAELINAGAVVDKPTQKLPDVKLCSGLGAYHSDNHKTNPKPYLTVSLTDIEQLVKCPNNVDKSQGQWVILSTLLSRESVKQHKNGIFHAVWLDIDVHTEKHAIQAFLADLGIFYYWLYSTKSSTKTKQKRRVIIPLFSPANAFQFKTISEILNDKLAAAGIVPDRASERPNQVCYLPNKGEYYDFHIEHAPLFDWENVLAKEIEDKATKERLRLEEDNRLREQSRQRGIERMATGASSPIEAYNAAYDVEKNLKHFRYKKDGNKWLSPNSESGNAGVTVKDNHWFSSHASDYGIGQATSGGCHGDSFDLFVWYDHKGNRNAAIKAAGDMFTVSNGETFTQANQAAFKEQKQQRRDYIDYSTMPDFPPMDGVMTDKPKPKTTETENINKGHTNNDDPYFDDCPDFPPMDDYIDYSTMPEEPPPIGEPSKEPPISNGRAQRRKEHEQNRTESDRKPFSLAQFSLMGQSEAMKEKMLNDVFVLDGVAILGQATVFYAQFNTGKTLLTLWLLTEAIKEHRVLGSNVFYINADDTYKGLVTKNVIAEKYGFHMIAPNQNGFDPEAMQGYMRQMIDDETAHGKIIILDTVKKFTDTMDKKTGSAFMKRAREFVQAGGTLIMLGHTNKHKNKETGKVVYGGTNDIASDADCVYTIDTIGNSGTSKEVIFENIKSRGDVEPQKVFSYALKAEHYSELLESVTVATSEDMEKASKAKETQDRLATHWDAIEAIETALKNGATARDDVIKEAMNDGVSRSKITKALKEFTGDKLIDGALWRVEKGEKNAKSYFLLTETTAASYAAEKAKE